MNVKRCFNPALISQLFLVLILFSTSCGESPSPNRFDAKFNSSGKIKDDKLNENVKMFWTKDTRKSINKTECSNFNVIIDMSYGLYMGVNDSEPLMEAVLDDMIGKAHFHKVGQEESVKELIFDSKIQAFDIIKNAQNYGGAWSKLEPGLELAVDDLSKPTLFISDFLLDKGDTRKTENTSHESVSTTSVIEFPWAKEWFKRWFAAGNKLDVIVWPYDKNGTITNYYYCFFIPKDRHLEGSVFNLNEYYNLAKTSNEKVTKLSIDPLAISYSGRSIYEYIENGDKDLFNENNVEDNYSVLQFHYNEATNEDTYKELENLALTTSNESPWEISVSEKTENITAGFLEEIGSKVKTNSNWEFTSFSSNSLALQFDLKGGSNFAVTKAQEPILFISRHDLLLNSIELKEQFKIDANMLKCQVFADRNNFTHEALYKNIVDGLSEAQNDIKQLIQKEPLYTTYTITGIPKNK
jgi:hypothetical protein